MTDSPRLTKNRRQHGLHQLEARVLVLESLLDEERTERYALAARITALERPLLATGAAPHDDV